MLDESLVLFDRPQNDEYLMSLFAGQGRPPRIGQRVKNFELVRGLVAGGSGYAILNIRPALDHSYDGKCLVCLPIADDVPPAHLVLAMLGSSGMTRRVQAFVNSTVESIRQFDSIAFCWKSEIKAESFETSFSLKDTIRPEIVGTA